MNSLITSSVAPQFADLVSFPKGLCVSIFMPNYGSKFKKLSRFKNLLRQTEELLSANGRGVDFAPQLLHPAAMLPSQIGFWQRGAGIAVFLAEERFYHYHLPLVFEELVVVSDHLYLDPLSPLTRNAAARASALRCDRPQAEVLSL